MSRTQMQIMQEVVDKYMASGQPWPTTARQMAEWAIQNKVWVPPRGSLVNLYADQLSRAMSEEYITDAQGRRVRAKHVVRTEQGGNSFTSGTTFVGLTTSTWRWPFSSGGIKLWRIVSSSKKMWTAITRIGSR